MNGTFYKWRIFEIVLITIKSVSKCQRTEAMHNLYTRGGGSSNVVYRDDKSTLLTNAIERLEQSIKSGPNLGLKIRLIS